MKLWLKISLLCIILFVIALSVCCTILLIQSGEHTLQLTVQSTVSDQRSLSSSLSSMVSNLSEDDLNDVTQRSLIRYCFSTLADRNTVLISPVGPLYTRSSIEPEEILPLDADSSQEYVIKDINGSSFLIVGSSVTLMENTYLVYVVRDISKVYQDIMALAYNFIVICAVCAVVTVVLLLLLIRFALRPLHELNNKVRTIAGGKYNERAIIHENDEVGKLGHSFNSMAVAVEKHVAQLRDIAEQRRMFMSALTHEYKTPLTSVIGYSETLLWTKLNEETVHISLQHIHNQCRWLERLTQKLMKLLTLSGDAELEIKPEPVSTLFDEVKQHTAVTLAQKNLSLTIRCETDTLPMDKDLMISLLVNLVDNAAKASTNEQTIKLYAYDKTIEVVDEGCGIAPDQIPKIMQPFYRVESSRSKHTGGSGLGLALCQEIADVHGAKLVIKSALQKGTSVKVVFDHA